MSDASYKTNRESGTIRSKEWVCVCVEGGEWGVNQLIYRYHCWWSAVSEWWIVRCLDHLSATHRLPSQPKPAANYCIKFTACRTTAADARFVCQRLLLGRFSAIGRVTCHNFLDRRCLLDKVDRGLTWYCRLDSVCSKLTPGIYASW